MKRKRKSCGNVIGEGERWKRKRWEENNGEKRVKGIFRLSIRKKKRRKTERMNDVDVKAGKKRDRKDKE